MRTLNELTKADEPLPSVEVFALALRWVIEDRATIVDGYELATGGGSRAAARGLVESAPERLGHSVAAFILAEHKPGFIKAKVAEGRTGGKGKVPKYDPMMLDGLEHLGVRAQAKVIGCAPAHIYYLREQRAALAR